MNSHVVSGLTVACAAIGCWLPSLWLEPPAKKVRTVLQPSAAPAPAWQGLQTKVRSAGSAMAQFQAVVAGVRGHGAGLASLKTGEMNDLNCEEAEELTLWLAGEELAGHVTDGPAFLKSLNECDYHVREAALEAWAAVDPDAALTTLINGASDRFGTEEDLIKRLAARDPDKALAILKAAPKATADSSAQDQVWSAVLEACAEKGPDYVLAAIQSAPHDAQLDGMSSLLSVMAAKDPRAALAWREALPPGLQELAAETPIIDAWGKSDPEAALKAWLGMPNLAQNSTGQELAAAWAAKDPDGFFKWVNGEGEERHQFQATAARVMASKDIPAALAMVERMPPGSRRDSQLSIGNAWAQSDPRAAFTWARSLSDQADRAYVLDGILPHLTSLPDDERRTVAQELGPETSMGFRILWEVDRKAADNAFAAMPVEQQIRSLAWVTWESPAAAAGMLETIIQNLPAAPKTENAAPARSWESEVPGRVAELTSRWTARDPAAAAAWVRQLPPGESQSIAAANVALTWGRYDLPAAKAWAEQLPAGPAREKAGEQLAGLVSASGQ